MNRRDFIKSAIIGAAGVGVPLSVDAGAFAPAPALDTRIISNYRSILLSVTAHGRTFYSGEDGVVKLPKGMDWMDINAVITHEIADTGEVEIDLG